MGSRQSTEEQPPQDSNQNQGQQKMSEEDAQRVREQRTKAIAQRLEQQKREQALQNQEVIDFKKLSDQGSQPNTQSSNIQNESLKPTLTSSQAQTNKQSQIVSQGQNNQALLAKLQQEKDQRLQQEQQKQAQDIKQMQQQTLSQSKSEEQKQQPNAKSLNQKQTLTKEQRIHNFISDVFLLTNDPSSTNPSNKNKTFLYEYCGEDKQFTLKALDDILMCRLEKNKDENKLSYLYQSYRRLDQHLYVKEKIVEPDQVTEAKEQIVSYFNTCLMLPETFNIQNDVISQPDNDGTSEDTNDFNQMLMNMMQGGGGMPFNIPSSEKLSSNSLFMFTVMQNQLYQAFEKDGIAADTQFMNAFVKVLRETEDYEYIWSVFQTLYAKMHLNLNSVKIEKFRQAEAQLETIKLLFEYQEAKEAFVASKTFLTYGLNGKSIQTETLLGRYLSFSSLHTETKGFKEQYFRGMAKSSQQGISRMTEQVSEQLHASHKLIQEIISKLLKNKGCKDRVMSWLRQAVALNSDKQKTFSQVPLASDGFILNLMDLLLLFGKPFTGKFSDYHSHLSKVNCFYLLDDKFYPGASKIEKINQDQITLLKNNQLVAEPYFSGITVEPYYRSSLDDLQPGEEALYPFTIQDPNFITEIFFLSHLCINLMAKRLEQSYQAISKQINKAAEEKNLQVFEEFMGQKMGIDAHLLGKNTLSNLRSMFTFSGALFQVLTTEFRPVSLTASNFEDIEAFQRQVLQYSQEQKLKNLDGSQPPLDLAVLPIQILTNLALIPVLLRQAESESYYGKEVDLGIQVATNVHSIVSPFIKNPHAKAEMIKFLCYLVPQSIIEKDKEHLNPQQQQRREREDNLYKDIFFRNLSLRELLLEAIVHVYIDAERTGYYEKATFRFMSSMIMEFVWSDREYRERFVKFGKERPALFIEFCNFLINDVNNLLFEGLLELQEIRDFEELQQSPDFSQLDQEQSEAMRAKYEENVRKAKSHLQLSNMVVKLLQKVTIDVREPFISEEIGEPFANALNFCIDSLVSQKGLKLKVNNPDRFNFAPRVLLVNILMMYANMSEEEVFLKNVVNDSRSYKDETFAKALRILLNPKKGIQMDADRVEKFQVMVQRLKELKSEIDVEDGMYDDAPEDLLDPIMSTLMKDPVQLPSSGNIIDYLTIKKHLMNDPHDPFNRSPLTMEQLIPRPDIKEKIEEFKRAKREQKQ